MTVYDCWLIIRSFESGFYFLIIVLCCVEFFFVLSSLIIYCALINFFSFLTLRAKPEIFSYLPSPSWISSKSTYSSSSDSSKWVSAWRICDFSSCVKCFVRIGLLLNCSNLERIAWLSPSVCVTSTSYELAASDCIKSRFWTNVPNLASSA